MRVDDAASNIYQALSRGGVAQLGGGRAAGCGPRALSSFAVSAQLKSLTWAVTCLGNLS